MGGAKSSGSSRSGGAVAPTVSGAERPAPVLPLGVRVRRGYGGETIYEARIEGPGGNPVNILEFEAQRNSEYISYSFSVNGSLTRNNYRDPQVSRDIAQTTLKIARYDVSTRPEGTLFAVSAVTWDGGGESRARAYTAFGFSRPATAGDSQYAIKRNGRLQPLTYDQYNAARRGRSF